MQTSAPPTKHSIHVPLIIKGLHFTINQWGLVDCGCKPNSPILGRMIVPLNSYLSQSNQIRPNYLNQTIFMILMVPNVDNKELFTPPLDRMTNDVSEREREWTHDI